MKHELEGSWNIHEFIEQHHHVAYAECGISPDGILEYTVPNHLDFFINKAFGIKINRRTSDVQMWQIRNKIPHGWEAMDYMVMVSGWVSVWYSQALLPHQVTDKQLEALKLLEEHKIVDWTSDAHNLCVQRVGQPSGIRYIRAGETDGGYYLR
jgi:hypothetical protein